jgi:hypothetical protein
MPGEDGHWRIKLTLVRDCGNGAGVFTLEDGTRVEFLFANVRRVGLARDLVAEDAAESAAVERRLRTTRSRATHRQRQNRGINPAQVRAIIAAGKARGFTVEDLRGFTSQHSISKLTIAEASALLDRLNDRSTSPKPQASGPDSKETT